MFFLGMVVTPVVLLFVDEKLALSWHRKIRTFVKSKIQ